MDVEAAHLVVVRGGDMELELELLLTLQDLRVARFARTFGTLIQSGVPHLEALDILHASTNNVHMKGAVSDVQGSIREGAGFAVPMGESGMFDDIVINMVDVGEQTGELDNMLSKVADRYELEVDQTVDTTLL